MTEVISVERDLTDVPITPVPHPPKWELLAPTFPKGWRQAFTWAWHVARISQRKTKVEKINGQWRVWREK